MNTALMGVANQEAVRQVSAKANEPEWLLRKRLEALENFNRLEMPDLKYGSNVRLNIGDLDLAEVFDRADKGSINIKRDGPEAAIITNLAEALRQDENAKKHFETIPRPDN